MDNNKRLSICAYFLSKFDMQAVNYLGYKTRDEAMLTISKKLGKENTYLKRRRDEFDVLTGSHRKGQRKRKPTPIVEKIHQELKSFQFIELAEIVKHVLNVSNPSIARPVSDVDMIEVVEHLSESEIEEFINQKDNCARHIKRHREVLERVYNQEIPERLKKLYIFRCQICGTGTEDSFGYRIVEAHHIVPFSISKNNDADNIIVLCPNHHRLIHKAKPSFDRQSKTFIYPNGEQEKLMYNFHL